MPSRIVRDETSGRDFGIPRRIFAPVALLGRDFGAPRRVPAPGRMGAVKSR